MSSKLLNLKLKNAVSDESSDDEKESENDIGISLEKLNLGPKKKLPVLSIGGLLAHRVHKRDYTTVIPTNLRPDVVYGNFRVFKRPFCDDFLKFCFERFEVGLWSSAMERNIDGVLRTVMGKYRSQLLFVWDQEKCTASGYMSLEKKGKPIFLKELDKLWEEKPQYSAANTLLIDDEPCKALVNPPNTAIFPDKYRVENVEDNFLEGALQQFLDGLADAIDVPSYVKNHPFGQPAITASHADWDYYSNIVRRFGKSIGK